MSKSKLSRHDNTTIDLLNFKKALKPVFKDNYFIGNVKHNRLTKY
jgi:hypothetical protein